MCCVLLVDGRCVMMLEAVLYALEMLEGMRQLRLCMLGAVEGGLCLLEMPEVIRCMLLCMLEAVEGRLFLLELWR